MNAELKNALAERLLALADDELILGHRNSEWCSDIEKMGEDPQFANTALDEIAHAMTWYGVYAELYGKDPILYPSEMIYQREAKDFRSCLFVERPKGSWTYSMLRQFLFDAFEDALLPTLENSGDAVVAAAARKVRVDEHYHLRHSSAWVLHIGLESKENAQELQRLLTELWADVGQLFQPLPGDELLIHEGLFPNPNDLRIMWMTRLRAVFEEIGVSLPFSTEPPMVSRTTRSAGFTSLQRSLHNMARLFVKETW